MSRDEDVPIRVDFRDPETARTWIEETRIKRPYRPRFFAAFCAALASRSKRPPGGSDIPAFAPASASAAELA